MNKKELSSSEIGKRLIELGGGTPPQDDFMDIFKDIFNPIKDSEDDREKPNNKC